MKKVIAFVIVMTIFLSCIPFSASIKSEAASNPVKIIGLQQTLDYGNTYTVSASSVTPGKYNGETVEKTSFGGKAAWRYRYVNGQTSYGSFYLPVRFNVEEYSYVTYEIYIVESLLTGCIPRINADTGASTATGYIDDGTSGYAIQTGKWQRVTLKLDGAKKGSVTRIQMFPLGGYMKAENSGCTQYYISDILFHEKNPSEIATRDITTIYTNSSTTVGSQHSGGVSAVKKDGFNCLKMRPGATTPGDIQLTSSPAIDFSRYKYVRYSMFLVSDADSVTMQLILQTTNGKNMIQAETATQQTYKANKWVTVTLEIAKAFNETVSDLQLLPVGEPGTSIGGLFKELYLSAISFYDTDPTVTIGVPTQKIRIVAVLNDEDLTKYSSVGATITIDGVSQAYESTTVYSSVIGKNQVYTPEQFGGKYFITASTSAELGKKHNFTVEAYAKSNGKTIKTNKVDFTVEEDGQVNFVVDIINLNASKKYITGTTEKDAVSYGVGEEIVFKLSLRADDKIAGCDRFVWTMTADDGTRQSGTESGRTGELILRTALSKAGFVYLKVQACDKNGTPIAGVKEYNGGAGANISGITKTKATPADFDAFWSEQVKTLDSVEPELISCTEVETVATDFQTYAVKIKFYEGAHGNYVSGYLTVPKNAKPGSLKIRMWYNGYGVENPTTYWNQNTALFNVCAHSIEVGQDGAYYASLKAGKLNGYGFSKEENTNRDTVYFKEMILRDIQAFRFMKKQFSDAGTDSRFKGLWNGQTVQITGGSQGGFQSIAVAALEPGATLVDVYAPWLCDIGGQGTNDKQSSIFMPEYTDALEYYDTINFAKHISCQVVIGTVGLGDYTTPPAGVTALYLALPDQIDKKITYRQNRTHAADPVEVFEYTVQNN